MKHQKRYVVRMASGGAIVASFWTKLVRDHYLDLLNKGAWLGGGCVGRWYYADKLPPTHQVSRPEHDRRRARRNVGA